MATVVKPGQRQALAVKRSNGGLVSATYTLWLKHMYKFLNSFMEIGATVALPIMWMVLFGVCMDAMLTSADDKTYTTFIAPGVMLLTGLSAAIIGGSSLLMERLNGTLKEYLVAPVPRLAVLLGTLSSSLTKAVLQSLVVIWLSLFLTAAIRLEPGLVLAGLGLVLVYALGFAGVAAGLACKAKDAQSYHSWIMLLNLPVLFLSNVLYSLDKMPPALRTLALLNPTTYGVDALRNFFYGLPCEIGLMVDIPVLVGFMVFGLWLARRNFRQLLASYI
jgi:ABC-2 type transport system permease protein